MLDNRQTVHTREVAKAIRSLTGTTLAPEQRALVPIRDSDGDVVHYIAPNMVTSITRTGNRANPAHSVVSYMTGEHFNVDVEVEDLATQLGLSAGTDTNQEST